MVAPNYSLEVDIPLSDEEETGYKRSLQILYMLKDKGYDLIHYTKTWDSVEDAFIEDELQLKIDDFKLEVRWLNGHCECIGNIGSSALIISYMVNYDGQYNEPLNHSIKAINMLLDLKKILVAKNYKVQDYAGAHTT